MRTPSAALLFALGALIPGAVATRPLLAQTATDTVSATPGTVSVAPATPAEDPRELGKRAQRQFENFRRRRLPRYEGKSPTRCDENAEIVGNMCYWYDEDDAPPPPTPPAVAEARDRLLERLATLAASSPADNWIAAQRVRYLHEAGRLDDAMTVASECRSYGWWCDALQGFVLHTQQRFVESEAAFTRAFEGMTPAERCRWNDLTPLLDDDTRRQYNRTSCGTPERQAFEDRVWWYARMRYGLAGNDSRTEYYARQVYAKFLDDAPSAFNLDFDDAEIEMLLRFGWPIGWARGPDHPRIWGVPEDQRLNVISSEAQPAYRMIPPFYVVANPVNSDSAYWQVQRPPVVARYAPPYAKKLVMLEHQQGLFRRGDTALVVLAYDVSDVPGMKGEALEAALVLATSTPVTAAKRVVPGAPARGTITVRAPWGPILMSAEVVADSSRTMARARYGIRPPFGVGARVVLSDLLFYEPYGDLPTRVEDVLPHVIPSQKLDAQRTLGVYWEAYDTNPDGEPMTISLTVVPETQEARGFFKKAAKALRLAKSSDPVTVTVQDMSARGQRMSPRAVELDVSTLTPGEYLVQLEIEVAGQYTIRADRRIVVIAPK